MKRAKGSLGFLIRFAQCWWPEVLILAVAVVLRFWQLDIKPAHFDEGINGWFADQMKSLGYYRYDPSNYHGPLHFYAVFVSQALFGRSLWALRLPSVLASIGCVVAMLGFRRHFGRVVAFFGALCMAISPGYVFYGRYAIHESWQVLFLLLFVHGVLGLWICRTRLDLWLVSMGFAGMFLTKETWVLHVGCLVLAVPVLALLQRWIPSRPDPDAPRRQGSMALRDAVFAGVSGLGVIVFFYSGGFLDFGVLSGVWETFAHWFETGVAETGHTKPEYDLFLGLNYYWFALMARYEWPALAGVLVCVRFVWPADARWRWLAIASAGAFVAYSIVPYKTPWCIITFAWPFYLFLGHVLQSVLARGRREVVLLPLLLLFGSAAICLQLNFVAFTDEAEPYVYVQTHEDLWWVTDPLLALARLDPEGAHVKGAILLDSYYPLPWILGDFTRVGYFKDMQVPSPLDHDFIIIFSAREEELEAQLGKAYYKMSFRFRGGMEPCTAYLSVERYGELGVGGWELVSRDTY